MNTELMMEDKQKTTDLKSFLEAKIGHETMLQSLKLFMAKLTA